MYVLLVSVSVKISRCLLKAWKFPLLSALTFWALHPFESAKDAAKMPKIAPIVLAVVFMLVWLFVGWLFFSWLVIRISLATCSLPFAMS